MTERTPEEESRAAVKELENILACDEPPKESSSLHILHETQVKKELELKAGEMPPQLKKKTRRGRRRAAAPTSSAEHPRGSTKTARRCKSVAMAVFDSPSLFCFNCWDVGHTQSVCPEPETHQFCSKCGRPGVSLSTCSRCSSSFRKTRWDTEPARFNSTSEEEPPAKRLHVDDLKGKFEDCDRSKEAIVANSRHSPETIAQGIVGKTSGHVQTAISRPLAHQYDPSFVKPEPAQGIIEEVSRRMQLAVTRSLESKYWTHQGNPAAVKQEPAANAELASVQTQPVTNHPLVSQDRTNQHNSVAAKSAPRPEVTEELNRRMRPATPRTVVSKVPPRQQGAALTQPVSVPKVVEEPSRKTQRAAVSKISPRRQDTVAATSVPAPKISEEMSRSESRPSVSDDRRNSADNSEPAPWATAMDKIIQLLNYLEDYPRELKEAALRYVVKDSEPKDRPRK